MVNEYFKNIRITDIYTSNILRAQLTAQAIDNKSKPIILDFLKERSVSHQTPTKYTYKEEFQEMEKRLVEAKRFLENLPHGHFIVVSHAIFIKYLLSLIALSSQSTEQTLDQISNTLIIENASVSKCIFNKTKKAWRIDSLNDTSHLNK